MRLGTQPIVGREAERYVQECLGGPVRVTQTPHGGTTLAPAPSTMTPGQFYPPESVGKRGLQGQVLGMFVQDPVVDNVRFGQEHETYHEAGR